MKTLFDCETVWCCWTRLIEAIWFALWTLRWPIFIYAAVYTLGAALFLVYLRIKSEDGKLTVDTSSWAYMIAHPMRYGGMRSKDVSGSICAFYARMLHMLVGVWPFLLIWFIFVSIAGVTIVFLLFGHILIPDLREEMFFRTKKITFPLALVTLPITLVALAIYNFRALLDWLADFGWMTLCLGPVIVVIILAAFIVIWLRWNIYGQGDSKKVSALREVIASNKEKFCKRIYFK